MTAIVQEFPAFRGIGTSFRTDPMAEVAVLNAELADRVCVFMETLPSEVTRASRPATEAIFAEARALATLAKDVSSRLGIVAPDGLEDGFDFSFPTYSEFEQTVKTVETDLADIPTERFQRLTDDGPVFFSPHDLDGSTVFAVEDASSGSGIRHWIAKLFGALGFGTATKSIFELLEESVPEILEHLARNISGRRWRAVINGLKSIFRIITTGPFLRKLGERIGVKAATKLFSNLLAKFLPFIGWALLIGSLVWALAEEFI